MREHGTFKIKTEHNRVHTYPVGGFNELGIIAIRKAILEHKPDQPWLLVEHPKTNAGVTPDAAKELAKSYEMFLQHGCIGIALEVSITWQYAIEKQIGDDFPIEVYFSSETEQINNWLTNQHTI